MTIDDRLRRLVEALPDGGAVVLTREQLAGLLGDSGAVNAPETRDLSVEDVAAEVGRAESTVRTWLISGELKGYKLNRKTWRVPRAALRAYLDAQGAPSLPPCDPENVDIGAWRRVPREAA